MKMNLPQYVLTATNIFRYKTNILSKEFDILCFTSILCIFFSHRCPTSKGHFFRKQINSETLFWLHDRLKFNYFVSYFRHHSLPHGTDSTARYFRGISCWVQRGAAQWRWRVSIIHIRIQNNQFLCLPSLEMMSANVRNDNTPLNHISIVQLFAWILTANGFLSINTQQCLVDLRSLADGAIIVRNLGWIQLDSLILFTVYRYDNTTGTFTVPPGGNGYYYFSVYLTTYSSKFVYFDVEISGERLCTAFTDLNVMSSGDRVEISCSGISEVMEGKWLH